MTKFFVVFFFHFEAWKNKEYYLSLKNTVQLHFILRRSELCLNFPHVLRDGFDIRSFCSKQLVILPSLLFENCKYNNE